MNTRSASRRSAPLLKEPGFWKTVVLVLACLLGALPVCIDNKDDLNELFTFNKVTCDRQQKDAPASFQFLSLYRYAFRLSHAHPAAERVKVLYFGSDLPQIEGNVCQGRALTADLLNTLARQRPSVVALDKFYSPDSCGDVPQTTRALQDSVSRFPAHLIIGQVSAPADTPEKYSCECLAPNLAFNQPNVSRGYVALNEDILQIPLRWVIREEDRSDAREVQPVDSYGLAFATAVQLRPDLARSMRDDFEGSIVKHPYADFWDGNDPEQQSVRDFLCTNGSAEVRQRWHLDCRSEPSARLDVTGKAVVIGSQDVSDLKSLLGENQFGYQIHARYVAALLGGATLRGWELWARLSCALLFPAFVLYLIIMFDVDAHLPGLDRSLTSWLPGKVPPAGQRTGLHVMYAITILFGIVLIAYFVPFHFRYLPPLDLIASAVLLYLSMVQVFATERWIKLNDHEHGHPS